MPVWHLSYPGQSLPWIATVKTWEMGCLGTKLHAILIGSYPSEKKLTRQDNIETYILIINRKTNFNQGIQESIGGNRLQLPPIKDNESNIKDNLLQIVDALASWSKQHDNNFCSLETWLLLRKRGERFFLPTPKGPTHWRNKIPIHLMFLETYSCKSGKSKMFHVFLDCLICRRGV